MSHGSTDSTPSIPLDKNSKLVTSLGFIITIVAMTWLVASQWNKVQNSGESMATVVSSHSNELATVKSNMHNLETKVDTIQAHQEAQMEILRYLARDRKGPVPDAVKTHD